MKTSEIKKIVDGFTFKEFNLDKRPQYDVDKVRAIDLLTPKRIDVVAKYMYMLFKQQKIKSGLAEEVYRNHIEIFSEGGFYEPGSETKTSYEDFLKEYDQIYDSLKKKGFDVKKSLIPVGNDGVIINGGHRTAASILLDQEVGILEIPDHAAPRYDFKYFEKGKMPSEYLDFLISSYIRLTPSTVYTICLWPKAVKINRLKECEKQIYDDTNVIYKKTLSLTRIGLKNLMMHLYRNEQWVGGGKDNFMGTYGKVDSCYAKADTIVYFVEADSLETIINLKNKIRSIYGVDKRSVHITDTKQESLFAADLVLNSHGPLAMNCGYPSKLNSKLKTLEKQLSEMKNKDVILNPLYTLQYFGRDVKIEGDDLWPIKKLNKDVTYDARNFFTYCGFKLFAPEYAKELCDEKYAAQFDDIIKKEKISTGARMKESISRAAYRTKRRTKATLRKVGLLKVVYKIKGRHSDKNK
ncbi:hypothetical protein IK110_02640 [Candidatus Saccharibacteria bacterium]|nr:hypothetical protein [Candidatus Saccharibacteria bacterium]